MYVCMYVCMHAACMYVCQKDSNVKKHIRSSRVPSLPIRIRMKIPAVLGCQILTLSSKKVNSSHVNSKFVVSMFIMLTLCDMYV